MFSKVLHTSTRSPRRPLIVLTMLRTAVFTVAGITCVLCLKKTHAHEPAPKERSKDKPVLWQHHRSGLETKPVEKQKFHGISSISDLEKLSAAVAVVIAIVGVFVAVFVPFHLYPSLPMLRFFFSAFALTTYYGVDSLLAGMAFHWEIVERRLRKERRPQRIILIRHGESQANLDTTLYQRVPDNQIELSDAGQDQARQAGRNLRKIIGDETVKFYISPYKRSVQTYQGIIEGGGWDTTKIKAREDPRLREQDWGNFQNPKDLERVAKDRRNFGAFYYRMPNGESGADVYDRVTSLWDSIHRDFDHKTEKNYVLVTHGLTIRLFLMRYFQWTTNQFNSLWNPNNCQFAVLECLENGRYRLWTNEDWDNVEKQSKPKFNSQ